MTAVEAVRELRDLEDQGLVGTADFRLGRARRARTARCAWEARYVRTLIVTDLLVGLLAAAVAFGVRFGADVTQYNQGYLLLSTILPFAWVAALAMNRAYEARHLFVGTDEYQRVFRTGLALTAAMAVVSYAFDVRLSRGYVVIGLPLATLTCVLTRYLLRRRLHNARHTGRFMRRVVVVGHERAVAHLTRQLRRDRYHGLDVVGACLPIGQGDQGGRVRGVDLPVSGSFDSVWGAVEVSAADTVVVLSCPELDGLALRRLAWQLEREEVDLIVASALIDVAGDRTTIRPVDGLPMLHVEHARMSGAARVVKELVDRIGALVLLAVFGPLLIALALLIKRGSPGPVLFKQTRVGRYGREFRMMKFRTMYTDAEARLNELKHLNESDGVLFKMRNDPRVTPVGRLLRKFSLDELPQLLNVLRGDMSLVGPRPPIPSEVALYPDDMRRRFVVKPGLTGLWQVSGRADLSWEDSIRLDLRYVENWSLTLDLVILLRTLAAVWRGAGAY